MGRVGAGRGMDVLLRGLWGWKGLAQREGQAPRPTKSECDSAYAKPTERLLKAKCGGAEREDSAENLIDGADGEQSPPS